MTASYMNQNSQLTLREGLKEYFDLNPQLLIPESCAPETRDFFHNHDCIHVVFGCDTSFLHEARTDFWTLFSADVGVIKYLSVLFQPPIQDIYKDLKEKITPEVAEALKKEMKRDLLKVLRTPFDVFVRSRKMKKKWLWKNHKEYMDRPLVEIRAEFGIELL